MLAFYIPIALYCKLQLSPALTSSNILPIPLYTIAKTVFQMALIFASQVLSTVSRFSHGIVFVVMMQLYTVVFVRLPTYNHKRL
jgi:hypothetical protein